MKVGVVSDSHGNEENLLLAAKYLVEEQKAGTIIHLGDNFTDACFLEQYPVRVIRVPGVYSEYYQDPRIPNRVIEKFNGWKVLITHTPGAHYNDLPGDLVPEILIREKKIHIVLYGHTHIPSVRRQGGVFFINPGHLRLRDQRGHDASYALIEFKQDEVAARIFNLTENKQIICGKFSG